MFLPHDDASVLDFEAMLTRVFEMSRSTRYVGRLLKLAGVPIHPSGWAILSVLTRQDELSITRLADALSLEQSTVSRQLKPLESAGLVERSTDPGDRRNALIALSPAGRQVVSDVQRKQREDTAWFLRRWSDEDRLTLARLARKLSADIDEGRSLVETDNAQKSADSNGTAVQAHPL